jgi:hypothetical protein
MTIKNHAKVEMLLLNEMLLLKRSHLAWALDALAAMSFRFPDEQREELFATKSQEGTSKPRKAAKSRASRRGVWDIKKYRQGNTA